MNLEIIIVIIGMLTGIIIPANKNVWFSGIVSPDLNVEQEWVNFSAVSW